MDGQANITLQILPFAELKRLLRFTTGGEMLNPRGIRIEVSPFNESIYASTCLCDLVIPESMATWQYGAFKVALAVLSGNDFNCV